MMPPHFLASFTDSSCIPFFKYFNPYWYAHYTHYTWCYARSTSRCRDLSTAFDEIVLEVCTVHGVVYYILTIYVLLLLPCDVGADVLWPNMVIMCNRKVGFPVSDTVQLSHVLQAVAITQFISQSPSITEVDLLLRVCLEPIIWYSSLSAVGHRYSRYNWQIGRAHVWTPVTP